MGYRRRVTLALYFMTVLLFWTSLYIYMPTLPVYLHSKGGNLALVGAVLSMYGLWQALMRLPLGITADWLGRRKPFILVGLALAGLGAWIMGATEDPWGLIIGRTITGLAASTWVPLVVAFSSLFPPKDSVRASAMLTLVGSAGRVLATGFTGTLNELGGYSLAFSIAAGAAALAVVLFAAAHEQRLSPRMPSLSGIGRLIARRDVLLPSLISAVLLYANWTATFAFMPILIRQVGASEVIISIQMSLYFVVVTLGNFLATALVDRLGARRLVLLSFGSLFLGVGGAALAPAVHFFFAAQFCIGLSMGIGYPVLMGMSIQEVEERERTTAMGLYQSLYAMGMFGGPVLSGALADAVGIRAMLGLTAVFCLISGLLGLRGLIDPSRRR